MAQQETTAPPCVLRIILTALNNLPDFRRCDHAVRTPHLPQGMRQIQTLLPRCLADQQKDFTLFGYCDFLS